MNITDHLKRSTDFSVITCPRCHHHHTSKHGSYCRKGFHILNKFFKMPLVIPRYRCLNPDCRVCTFSALPCGVLRYCRFSYPGLLQVKNSLSCGIRPCRLAHLVWNVSTAVIKRAEAEITRMDTWIKVICREISDGGAIAGFSAGVKFLTRNMAVIDLTERYGYHRYPHRLACAK